MQIGEILREQREAKNISLNDIQAETKIQKRYLAAIEEENFHALPGKFYARAFIKEYALVVGLDPEELLKNFDEQDIEPEEPVAQYTRMDRAKQAKNAKGSSFWSSLPTIIVIILVVGILFVAWLLMNQKAGTDENDNMGDQTNNNEIIREKRDDDRPSEDDNQESTNDEEQTTNNADEEKEEDEQTEDKLTVIEEGTGGFPESELDFTYSGDEVEVSFDVTNDTYVELQGEDGEAYLAETLNADGEYDTYDVTEEEEIFIKTGNAQGVTISINDVEVEYPVDTDTVTQKLRIHLKKDE